MVERTCPAKNRANSDIIESFFQEDPCMDLASRLIWRCFIETPSNESARKSKFCQIIWVTFITLWFHEFFQLLLILSSSKILCRFFCQIIMGSPLNNNVSKGRSVDRWNFQQVLDLGFPETSQSLSSFKQLLFSSFHRGDQRKKNQKTVDPPPPQSSSSFPNRDPLLKIL